MNRQTLTTLFVKRPESKREVITLLLSGVFFFTNVLVPYAAENDFWAERQKAVQKMKQESDLLGTLASASLHTPKQPVSRLNQEQYQLLAQLPHVTKLDLVTTNDVSLSPFPLPVGEGGGEGIIRNKLNEIISPKLNNAITQKRNNVSKEWLSAILPYGSIGDIYISQSPTAPLVIHIQDVHGVLEAQKNISNIITAIGEAQSSSSFSLGEKVGMREKRGKTLYNLSPNSSLTPSPLPQGEGEHQNASVVIGVEGAAGSFNIHPYRNFPDTEVTKDIAEYFLKEGYIGGPEFAALTAPEIPLLWGVEDLPLYEKNIQTIYDSQKNKPQLQATLDQLKTASDRLKEKVYSKELKEFDEHFNAYKNEQEKLGEYVRYLMTTSSFSPLPMGEGGGEGKREQSLSFRATLPSSKPSPIGRRERNGARRRNKLFPNLNLLLQALNLEETLDFKAVEQERIQLIETLVKKLTQEQLTELVQESINYKLGHLNYSEYHQYLKQLCKNNRIPIRNFTKLNSYINYVGLAERINRNKLLDELTNLEEQVQNSLAITPEQKRLAAANKSLIMLEKLANHNMTTDDWKQYESLSSLSSLRFLSQKNQRLNEPNELNGLKELLTPFEDFCRYATQRNEALINNLLTELSIQSSEKQRIEYVIARTAKQSQTSISFGIATSPSATRNDMEVVRRNDAMDSKNPMNAVAVLVAGGFHTAGLTQILRQKDISYVVVTPKITEVPKDNHYLDVFARKPLPLEKLFSGEKIFIVHPPLLGTKQPVVDGINPERFEKEAVALQVNMLSTQMVSQLADDKELDGKNEAKYKKKFGTIAEETGLPIEVRDLEVDTKMGVTIAKLVVNGEPVLAVEGPNPTVVAKSLDSEGFELTGKLMEIGNEMVGIGTRGKKFSPQKLYTAIKLLLQSSVQKFLEVYRRTPLWNDRGAIGRGNIDPNTWRTIKDVKKDFPFLSDGAIKNLLKAREALPNGQFESLEQLKNMVLKKQIKGISTGLWLQMKDHLILPSKSIIEEITTFPEEVERLMEQIFAHPATSALRTLQLSAMERAMTGDLTKQNQSEPGFKRFLSDIDIRTIVNLFVDRGLGFVIKDGIKITRTKFTQSTGVSFPMHAFLTREPSVHFTNLKSEVILIDLPETRVNDFKRFIFALFYPKRFTDLISAHPDLRNVFELLPEQVKNEFLSYARVFERQVDIPQENFDTVRELAKTGLLHELGETMWTVVLESAALDENPNSNAKRLINRWRTLFSKTTTQGYGLFRLATKFVGGYDPNQQLQQQMFNIQKEIFADKFAMFMDPASIYFRMGWNLTSDEQEFFEEVLQFFKDKYQRGENSLSVYNPSRGSVRPESRL